MARLVMFLAVTAVLILATTGSAPPGWQDLKNTISGQGFPTFNNPFSSNNRHYTLQPDGNDPTNTFVPSTGIDQFETEALGVDDPNCDTNNHAGYLANPTSEYWGCIAPHFATAGEANEPDGLQTRVTLSSAGPDMQVSLDSYTGSADTDHLIRTISVTFNCISGSSEKVFIVFSFNDAAGTPIPTQVGDFDKDACLTTGGFVNHTATADVSLTGATIADYNNGRLYIATGGTPSGAIGLILLTWVSVDFEYSPTRKCTGSVADQANCYIGQFIQFLIDLGTLIVNVIVFLFQVLVFIVTLIIQFFTGLTQLFGWLLGVDPASPLFTAPDIVKGIVAVLVLGALFYIIIEGIRLLAEVIGAIIP